MTPEREDLTSWLIELLKDEPGDFSVGDHGPPEVVSYPFWIVWSIPGGGVGGPPLGAAAADASFVFQVDSVGQTREQAGRLATRSRDRIIGRARDGSFSVSKTAPSGTVVLDRYLDGPPGAPQPEGDRPHETWTSSERFVLEVTAEV